MFKLRDIINTEYSIIVNSQNIITEFRGQAVDASEARVREGDELNAQVARLQQELTEESQKAAVVAQLLNTIQQLEGDAKVNRQLLSEA
jgi:hypothetical protein